MSLVFYIDLALQFCRKGINVTIVCPGPIKTSSAPAASNSPEKEPAEVHLTNPCWIQDIINSCFAKNEAH